MPNTLYDRAFYDANSADSRKSAAATVPIVMRMLNPRCVVDVGCGTGTWLAEFANAGIDDCLGIDGNYVPSGQLQIPSAHYRAADLTERLQLGRTYDLAISLEVGEHLPNDKASTLVDSLVAAAPAVLFSAAIPGQHGAGHVNEQWQDYWRALFYQRAYVATDVIRREIWGRAEIKWWYQQNMVLYIKRDALNSLRLDAVADAVSINVVHPDFLKQVPTAGEILPVLPYVVKNSVRYWLGIG